MSIEKKVLDIKCRFCLEPASYIRHHNKTLHYKCKTCKEYDFWVDIKSGLMLSEYITYKYNNKNCFFCFGYYENKISFYIEGNENFVWEMQEFKTIKEVKKFVNTNVLLF